MDRHYPGPQYADQQYHQHEEYQQQYPDYQYSYPPQSGPQHEDGGNQHQTGYLQADNSGYNEKDMHRQHSYADSDDAATRVVSFYDEKGGASSASALQSTSAINNNPSLDYIPPAIPRPKDPNSKFKPGHVTRGSVALQAAIEGQIPKKEGLKMWRSDEHQGIFTAGGKRRAAMRCCCCTLIFAFILVVGIVAAFLLWVRPPNIQFQGITAPQDGSQQLTVTSSGFDLNFDLDIAVSNPNFFGASFKRIAAKAYYPTKPNQAVGGGEMQNVKIPAHSHNKLYFPFNLNYTKSIDPDSAILLDIATKCGFVGDAGKQDITVNYDLTLALNIVGITISPTFRSKTSFACPLSQSDVEGLVGSAGLGSLTGGGSRY
ncbi:hypothetical protein P389DRAFT_95495 [Cystobasidium minutum MCA 4210]|uniref:uncharacterized protein n=1 Tax=Cystobasidium minutum MCA 4210 TaxID=1397322 RepID=UPI0034CD7D03|eukprot:jgi/Rhomi1/95495/CE95494_262